MIAIFLLSIVLNTEQQNGEMCSWICSDIKFVDNGNYFYPKIRLDIIISKKKVSGKLKIYDEGKIIRVSDLVGIMYMDGSVSLAERWVDGKDFPWIPNYSSILITDINAPEFRLNYNSATRDQSHIDKGQIIFKKLAKNSRS